MNLWRLHVRPDAKETFDPVDVCLTHRIIGVGWRVSEAPDTGDAYLRIGEREYGDRGWRTAANAIVRRIAVGDLVWFRSTQGVYYLALVTGPWQYRVDSPFLEADIVNTRPAEIVEVGPSVPGKIVSSFYRGATLQTIGGETSSLWSAIRFNELSRTRTVAVPKSAANLFDLIRDDELEDAVGLYLQSKHEFVVVPSSRTRRNDTIFYEYQLLSERTGRPAYVQVKSGDEVIDFGWYVNFPCDVWVFSPAGYVGTPGSHVRVVDKNELRSFLFDKASPLPDNLRVWVQWAIAHGFAA